MFVGGRGQPSYMVHRVIFICRNTLKNVSVLMETINITMESNKYLSVSIASINIKNTY